MLFNKPNELEQLVKQEAADRKKLAQMTEDSDREPLPLDRSEVVEEDVDRVEDGVDH